MNNSKINFSSSNKAIFQKFTKPAKVEYTNEGDLEQDSLDELNELQKQFREKAKKEKELKAANIDTEFWSCVIFKSREERDKFCELLNIATTDNQYINGRNLIRALEMQIELLEIKTPGKFKTNKEIYELAMDI